MYSHGEPREWPEGMLMFPARALCPEYRLSNFFACIALPLKTYCIVCLANSVVEYLPIDANINLGMQCARRESYTATL